MVGQGARSTIRPRPRSGGSTTSRSPPTRLGFGSLVYRARQADPDWRYEHAMDAGFGEALRSFIDQLLREHDDPDDNDNAGTTGPGAGNGTDAGPGASNGAGAGQWCRGRFRWPRSWRARRRPRGAGLGWPRRWCGPWRFRAWRRRRRQQQHEQAAVPRRSRRRAVAPDGRERRGTAHRRRRERRGARLDLPRRVVVAENGASIHGSSTRSK